MISYSSSVCSFIVSTLSVYRGSTLLSSNGEGVKDGLDKEGDGLDEEDDVETDWFSGFFKNNCFI